MSVRYYNHYDLDTLTCTTLPVFSNVDRESNCVCAKPLSELVKEAAERFNLYWVDGKVRQLDELWDLVPGQDKYGPPIKNDSALFGLIGQTCHIEWERKSHLVPAANRRDFWAALKRYLQTRRVGK